MDLIRILINACFRYSSTPYLQVVTHVIPTAWCGYGCLASVHTASTATAPFRLYLLDTLSISSLAMKYFL